jgi:hypothetical protein
MVFFPRLGNLCLRVLGEYLHRLSGSSRPRRPNASHLPPPSRGSVHERRKPWGYSSIYFVL